MANIRVRVRPGNSYQVSRSEAYYAGEEFDIDERELAAVSHCLISAAEDDAHKIAKAERELAAAKESVDLFQAAREGAIQAERARREALERASKLASDEESKARKHIESEISRPVQVPKPRSSKKPDLA